MPQENETENKTALLPTDKPEEKGGGNLLPPGEAPAETPKWMTEMLASHPELLADKTLARFADVPALAKSALETQKAFRSSLRIPSKDAKPDEWNELWGKLGRPESPDKYEVTATIKDASGKDIPLPVNKEFDAAMRKIVHEAGITNDQYNRLWQGLSAYEQEKPKRFVDEIKKEWGGDYEKNAAIANAEFSALPKPLAEALMGTFGAHPLIVKLLHYAGMKSGEDAAAQGGQAADELATLKKRKEELLQKQADNPNDTQVQKELRELYQKEAEMNKRK